MTTTVEEAFAAWRLANPALAGWPLDAFKAGWAARCVALEEATRDRFHFCGDISIDVKDAGGGTLNLSEGWLAITEAEYEELVKDRP